ncbi:MAG: alpha/beta hydrolase [Cytophagaceae bacterium]|nr:alpha/beta hydrolase [Cytophagaceae bacterium]
MKLISTTLFLLLSAFAVSAQQVLPLYGNGPVPNTKVGVQLTEKQETTGGILRISNVQTPTLTVYQPAKGQANGTAVVICPGGGYTILAASHEGSDVANEFVKMGVTAFVLKYRLPSSGIFENTEIGPLQDAQQAIRLVRQRAEEFGVNPNRVGILGFSAGGHLASTAATHFDKPVGTTDPLNIRPDFAVLAYPVISFMPPFTHKGSAQNLLGKEASEEKKRLYSNELQVTDKTPPIFLVHAADDTAVPVENSLEFFKACKAKGVSAELHIYPKGGHGFGLVNKTTPDRWMDHLKNWMDSMGWLKGV